MRVGLIAPPWVAVPPPRYGGTELVVSMLATGLVEAGVEVVLFTVGDSSLDVETRSYFEGPATPMCASVPEAAHVLAAYEELHDVDLIHDHTILGPVLADGVVPTLATHHGPFGPTEADIFRRSARHVGVIAISATQARDGRG